MLLDSLRLGWVFVWVTHYLIKGQNICEHFILNIFVNVGSTLGKSHQMQFVNSVKFGFCPIITIKKFLFFRMTVEIFQCQWMWASQTSPIHKMCQFCPIVLSKDQRSWKMLMDSSSVACVIRSINVQVVFRGTTELYIWRN